MKKTVIFLLGILTLVLIIMVFKNDFLVQKKENKAGQNPTITQKFQTQTNSEGEVTVEVTPISLSAEKNVEFKVVLNTHSVALDKDLKDISVLFDDQNNQYKPISWSGGTGGSPRGEAGSPRSPAGSPRGEAGAAGHHLEGILTFPPLLENTKSVKLIIKGINNIDREFLFLL